MNISLENMWIPIKIILTLWISSAYGQEITCTHPYIPNGAYKPEKSIYRVDDLITYECKGDFHPSNKNTRVKCTDTGWVPAPRCIFKPCEFPKISHGALYHESRYKPYFPAPIGKYFYYYCDQDYVPQSNRFYGIITCTQSGWEPMPTELCRRTCVLNDLENGKGPRYSKTYQQGQSIKAECYRGYSLPNGENFMTCTENGWDPPPRCIRIKSCDRPVFENARTQSNGTLFKLNDRLDYECEPGYVNKEGRTMGSIVCGHNDWSDKPECFVRPCDFPKISHGALYYESRYKPYFPAPIGKYFYYYCDQDYVPQSNRFYGIITCTQSGWEPMPTELCRRTCVFNDLENGKGPRYSKKYQQGQSIKAECNRGFSLPNGESFMTCTENGWDPPPRCIQIKTCSKSDIEIKNGFFLESNYDYSLNTQTQYKCQPGYTTENGETTGSITCQQSGWSEQPICIKTCSKSDIEIKNGFFSESEYVYSLNKQAQYKCQPGYTTANGETAGTITCQQGGWSEQPMCIKSCKRPVFKKARTQSNGTLFKLNDQLDYECELGYENKEGRTSGSIVCGHNDWSDKPECFGKCIFNYLENGHYPWISKTYYQGQSVRAECYFGYSLQNGENNMTCTETGWNPPPRCILVNATGKCGTPPPIANGDITSFPLQEYAPESEIEYKCQNLYKLEGDEIIRCHNGQWSQPPKCLNPCVISEDIMNKHRLELRWNNKNIHYIQSGEFVEFACKTGYTEDASTNLFRQFCIDGKIIYPTCQ